MISSNMAASTVAHAGRADLGIRFTNVPVSFECLRNEPGSGAAEAFVGAVLVVVLKAGVAVLAAVVFDPLRFVDKDGDELPAGVGGWLEPGHLPVLGP